MKYINDEQIINDAAQMLIEKHLSWSGSNDGMPSDDLGNVGGILAQAYLESTYTHHEWSKDMEEEWERAEESAELLYSEAKQLADKKWEAAMAILGI